jgi:hypothetical protein
LGTLPQTESRSPKHHPWPILPPVVPLLEDLQSRFASRLAMRLDDAGETGFASCPWPIWRTDDFTRCFQRE